MPIERVRVHVVNAGTGVWGSGTVEPYALVVRDANGTRAVGIDAASVSLERLKEEVPALAEVLASL